MGENGVHGSEHVLPNPTLDDLPDHGEGPHRVDQDLLVEMRPTGDDLAQHHPRQVRAPTVRGVAHDGDKLTQDLIRGTRVGAQGFDATQELCERLAKNGSIELKLAAEVITDEG